MKKRILNISLILALASTGSVFAQQGFGTNTPDKSAAVDIVSSNKGLLIPRMDLTWENSEIVAPVTATPIAQGLLVYNKTAITNVPEGFYYYDGTKWNPIGVSVLQDSTTTTISGSGTTSNPYKVEVRNLAGDVTGNVLTNKVEKIQNVSVSVTPPTTGQFLKEVSGTWTPYTLIGSDVTDSKSLTTTSPLKVNGVNTAANAVLNNVSLTVDKATASTLGVVQVGNNIDVTDGVISVTFPQGTVDTNTITSVSADQDYVTIDPTLTTGAISTRDYKIGVNKATDTTLGVVMPGNGLSVDGTGKLDVTFPTIDGTETKLANGLNTTIDGNGTTTTPYKVDVATGNGRTLGVVREVETNPTVNVTNGDLSINLTNTILAGEVTGPLNATIVADDVIDAANLKTDAVTTVKILNANVTPIKIQPATTHIQTQVMVTGTDGLVQWVDQSTISPTTTHTLGVAGNTLTSTVNGVAPTTSILNNFSNELSGTTLTTHANGLTAPINLAQAIKAGETLTSLSQNATTGVMTYNPESGPEQTANVLSATAGNVLSYSSGVFLDKGTIQSNQEKTAVVGTSPIVVSAPVKVGDTSTFTVSANNATNTTVGVVKPGAGLTVAEDGTLTATGVTADNGLTLTTNNIQLGGVLTKATEIGTTATKTLAISGLDKTKNQQTNATVGFTQHLLAVDATGNTVKALKAAMPKFFYMPSVLIPTAASQIEAGETNITFNNGTRTGTINLYEVYKKQFGTAIKSSGGSLPVLPANELNYHVTYATPGVFPVADMTISTSGLLTYKVSSTADINNGTFMNIVFSVKED